MMNNGMKPIETHSKVKRALVATLSYEQIEHRMDVKSFEDELESYGNDEHYMTTNLGFDRGGSWSHFRELQSSRKPNENLGNPRQHTPAWKQRPIEQNQNGIGSITANNIHQIILL